MVTWKRKGGYEVSSKGDHRFSAFNARFPSEYFGGRTIEEIYQCDIKGTDPGGVNWRLGKGKPPKNPNTDLWKEYLNLWLLWSHLNIGLMRELYTNVSFPENNFVLSDMFSSTEINQAHALAECLNELLMRKGPNPAVIEALQSPKYKQRIYPM